MQMRVERSQDNDFIADNEELRGEDFDEDADVSDDDADLSDDDVEAQASEPKKGPVNTNSCPAGTVAMSEQECKDAAKALLGTFRKTKSYKNHPKGCMVRGKKSVLQHTCNRKKESQVVATLCETVTGSCT